MRTLFLSLLLTSPLAAAQPGGGPPPVRVALARSLPMSATVTVPGTVVSRQDARIAAEVEGRLLEVADVGTRVAAGDVVARIEDTVLKLRRAELEAQVASEESRLAFLRREEQRLARLAEQNNAAKTQLDQTRSNRDAAYSDKAVAQARLAQVEDQLERTQIRAPFDGEVVERLRREGERVGSGTEILRIVNPDSLEVIARAPLEYLEYLEIGDVLSLSRGERQSEGSVRTVVAVGDEDTHVFETRINVPGGSFPVGQTLRVELPASEVREVLAVPRDALVLRADGITVYVIGEDGSARRVEVETGLASGDLIEVRGAIADGDRVVIRGNERLRPGQTVSIMGEERSADS